MEKVQRLSPVVQLGRYLARGESCSARGPVRSAAALIAAALLEAHCRSVTTALALCPGVEYAEEFTEDLNLFSPGLACLFPPMEDLPGGSEEPDEAILKARLDVLRHLLYGTDESESSEHLAQGPQEQTRVVCASVNAALCPTPSAAELRRRTRDVEVGQQASPGGLAEWLVDNGFASVPRVGLPGHYSLRGGILDVFSHASSYPVRVEFFGDEVDSIRTFDPSTQLSKSRIKRCQLIALADPRADPSLACEDLSSLLPQGTLIILLEPRSIWERADEIYGSFADKSMLIAPQAVRTACQTKVRLTFSREATGPPGRQVNINAEERDNFGPDLDSMLAELERVCAALGNTVVFCANRAESQRLARLLRDRKSEAARKVNFMQGRLNHGILWQEAGLALIPHNRLFGRYRQRRVLRHIEAARPLESTGQLEPGDLVVHVQYGIGRFHGIEELKGPGQRRQHLKIEFADDVIVYVPNDRIELVHRYIGIGARRPQLSKTHGKQWQRVRNKAEQAAFDLAAELLELQARRATQPGISTPAEGEWQQQFEAEFPYEETEDQLRAIDAVKRDMASPTPMDRLICGDVGYGKTEVAMRAAFRVAMEGRQAAVLVPTTVLAQQHCDTFRERMADYPIRVEMLSRFLTAREAAAVLEGMAAGQVDIVIGTHRLLQDDVSFKDLGVVVIDEEQRFGVRHKEKLKKLRSIVDVLTLTATPIPRTLHMALMGVRDISSLQTPPRDRQAIETHVRPFDPAMLRQAVLRELNREGQVFVIHNRIRNIGEVADRIRRIVPEAVVAVAHGQMNGSQLSETMRAFQVGRIDVLVSTTIVENGLDIPNANTLIINRADLLGLAELHQLRGRVGRYIHKAYAYLFRPRSRPITPEAEKRLAAIRRYSQLGAGFDIALRDLEIRGAGNILGPEQSGHVAAIGYHLYCHLLERAVQRLKGEPASAPPVVNVSIGMELLLPDDYVPTPRQKIDLYRRLSRACTLEDVDKAEAAMRDIYGAPPVEAENLLLEARIRVLADASGVDSVQLRDGRVFFGVKDREKFRERLLAAGISPRMVEKEVAVMDVPVAGEEGRALGLFLQDLLGRGVQRRAIST